MQLINYVHRTFIVPASAVEQARQLASAWHSGQGMFVVALAAESDPSTVTHYISTGKIGADVAALLDDPAAFVSEINERTGGSYTEAEVQAVRDAMDISTESGHEAMARLGLVFYEPPEDNV